MFEVIDEYIDRVHFLGKFSTFEEAKAFAYVRLPPDADWVDPNKAIDMFGGVLQIEVLD